MARDYKVQGTTSFLNWAALFLVLFLWFTKDGWFPRQSVREKHGDPPANPYNIFALSENPSPGQSGSYYPFNRIGSVVWAVSAVVCLYIHFVVK
jgi:hypothetical protein